MRDCAFSRRDAIDGEFDAVEFVCCIGGSVAFETAFFLFLVRPMLVKNFEVARNLLITWKPTFGVLQNLR
jgi:hypothetical protein